MAATLTLGVAMLLLTPQVSSAAKPEEKEPQGKAYGFFLNNLEAEAFAERFTWLPPGIAKLFERMQEDEEEEDIIDPTLTNLTTVPATSTADVSATFDEAVKATLLVATSSGFDVADPDVLTFTHNDFETFHSFSLGGLDPDTEHFFRIAFEDEAGNSVLSDEASFSTDELPDETAPTIIDIDGTVSTSSLSIEVATNEPTTVTAYASTSSGFDTTDSGLITVSAASLLTLHSLDLTGLSASTTYFLRIVATDDAANATTSAEFPLSTL